jgi:DNA polymerase-4
VGERLANHLVELANGRDDWPVEVPREAQSLGKETTFEEDLHSGEEAEHHLLYLSSQVGWRLRCREKNAHTVQIKIRLADFSTFTRQKTLSDAICYDEDIFKEAKALFRAFPMPDGSGIRLLGVSCSGFDAPSEISLFEMENKEKKERLYTAIDKIKAKFGEDKIARLGEARLLK